MEETKIPDSKRTISLADIIDLQNRAYGSGWRYSKYISKVKLEEPNTSLSYDHSVRSWYCGGEYYHKSIYLLTTFPNDDYYVKRIIDLPLDQLVELQPFIVEMIDDFNRTHPIN